jgi:hypothetical protein
VQQLKEAPKSLALDLRRRVSDIVESRIPRDELLFSLAHDLKAYMHGEEGVCFRCPFQFRDLESTGNT